MFSVLINYWYTPNLRWKLLYRFRKSYLIRRQGLLITEGLAQEHAEEMHTILDQQKKTVHDMIDKPLDINLLVVSLKVCFCVCVWAAVCTIAATWTILQRAPYDRESSLYPHSMIWSIIVLLHMSLCLILHISLLLINETKSRWRHWVLIQTLFFILDWSLNGLQESKSKWNLRKKTKKCGRGDNFHWNYTRISENISVCILVYYWFRCIWIH